MNVDDVDDRGPTRPCDTVNTTVTKGFDAANVSKTYVTVGVSPITPPVRVVVPSADRKNHVQLYAQATPGAHARAEPSNVTGSPTCGVDVLITNDGGGGGGGGGGGVVVVTKVSIYST